MINNEIDSRFKVGCIYLTRYRAYKQDPSPLILVLYPGTIADFHTAKSATLMHAINLNYLRGGMIDSVMRFVAMVATKQLSARDMKSLYHDHIKRELNPAIRNAYRTYDPAKITSIKLVSKGFGESVAFLDAIKTTFNKDERVQKVAELVNAKVTAAKHIETVAAKVMSLGGQKGLSLEEAERRARLYMDAIAKAKRPEEIDFIKYTRILRNRQ